MACFSRSSTKRKIFCVGLNKTGTTSLELFLKNKKLKIGSQKLGELSLYDLQANNLAPIMRLCGTADVFQDVPFSIPFFYETLDRVFPDARFILTVRKSPQRWFESLVRYHKKMFCDAGEELTEEVLANATYRRRGWILEFMKYAYDYPRIPLYEQDSYMEIYEQHRSTFVRNFVESGKGVVVDVSDDGDVRRLCEFIEVDYAIGEKFPWLNKST